MTTIVFLAAGACFDPAGAGGAFLRCALQASECGGGAAVFRSAGWLALAGNNRLKEAEQCSEQSTLLDLRKSMGRCDAAADRYICTSDKTGCRFNGNFEPMVEDCTLAQDFYQDNEFANAHFGYCLSKLGVDNFYAGKASPRNSYFCAWRYAECNGGDELSDEYAWRVADIGSAEDVPDCTCDDVEVGMCVSSDSASEPFCAVTAGACGEDNYSYLTRMELRATGTTCKLCDTIPETMRIKVEVAAVDEEAAGVGVNGNVSTSVLSEPTSEDSGTSVFAVVIAILIGGCVIFGVVLIGLVFYFSRKREKKLRTEDQENISLPSIK